LGERLYEEFVRSDPTPGDPEWADLAAEERDLYCRMAYAVVRKYEVAIGLPVADL